MSKPYLQMKYNIFRYRTGILLNQKRAVVLKSPLAFSGHSVDKQIVLTISFQGVNTMFFLE